MSKQTIAILGGAVALFGVAVGASLGVIGNEESPAKAPAETTGEMEMEMEMEPGAHTMPGGGTMTGPMEETTGEEMPGMTMTEPMDEEPGGHTMPGGQEMPGMTMTTP